MRLSLTMVIQRTFPQDAAAMLAPAILETVDLPLLSLDRDLRIAGRYPVEAFGSTLLEQHSSGQPIVVCNVSRAHAGAELESFTQLGIAAYIGVPWSRTAASSRV
jgi:hypothetical protein